MMHGPTNVKSDVGSQNLKNTQKSAIFRVIQERLSLQGYVELFDWPARGPDMNPIEDMWNGVK
jgi:hypothetical protein